MLQEIKMKSREFIPMQEYVLVLPDKVITDEFSSSGIIIQHQKSVTMRPCAGKVLAVGSDCRELEPGDYVVFPDTDGIDVKFLDSNPDDLTPQFLLLRYKSIIGRKA